jgi:Zn-dependent peptidase ImmA (M78 family)/transcriptional regulator with XRE-family HTH domain
MSLITPSRLAIARKRRGLSLAALARISGVSTRSLTNYEGGYSQPSQETFNALAKALEIPTSFLSAPEIEGIVPEAASFRALSKMSAPRRDEATAAGRLGIELNHWIESLFRLPQPNVPRLERDGQDPDIAASVVRASWNLGELPISNVIHLVESQGIRIFTLPERLSEVDAFSLWWGDTPFMFLNPRKSGERGRFDAAHELGHLVMHADIDLPRTRERENEANRFAASLLMPEASVRAAGLLHATIDRILLAKRKWNVAAMALTHRLHELDLLTDWEYQSRCKQLAQRGYRHREPSGVARESSQLLEKVFHTLREQGISTAQIAEGVHLSTDELNEYVFGLVLTVVRGGAQTSAAPAPKFTVVQGGKS